ncbi:hypothetical protein [Pseudothermotoga thermarum]|nr:hypothetical protein [Pseudothermotoga thermarum]
MRYLVIFFVLSAILVGAQSVVIYQFEVVQLSQQVVAKAGLDELKIEVPSSPNASMGIFYSASAMQLLAQFPLVTVKFGLGEKEEKTKLSSRPWVSTVLGQKATVFVGREEIVLQTGVRKGQGIRLEITPISIAKEGVLTKLTLADPYGPTTYDNEQYVDLKDFKPIALISSKSENGFDYFAIYAKATVAEKLPETNVYSVGSLDELAKVFMKDEFVKKENSVYAVVVTDFSSYDGEANILIWVNDAVIQAKVTFNPLTFVGGVEGLVDKLGLRVGAKFYYDNGMVIGFGVSDHARLSEILTAFAELYPFRIDISELKFVSPSWRAGLSIDYEKFSMSLGTFDEGKLGLWADGAFKVSENFSVLAGVRYIFEGKIVFFAGLRISF